MISLMQVCHNFSITKIKPFHKRPYKWASTIIYLFIFGCLSCAGKSSAGCWIGSLYAELLVDIMGPNGPTFTTHIITDWMRDWDRHDDCYLKVHLEKDLLLCLPETDTHTAMQRWNNHFHCDSGAIVFHRTGDTSVRCQSEHGPHSYDCISSSITSAQLSLCALRAQLLRTNNTRTVSKQSKGSFLLNSAFIWKPRWDSLRRVLLKFLLRGLCHLLPGWCAPSAWANHPKDSAVPTSTSAILRGLWATHPLTHRVCSRGQIGGKWGAAEDSQSLCCVWEDVWLWHWRQFKTWWMISVAYQCLHDIGLWMQCLSWNGLDYK